VDLIGPGLSFGAGTELDANSGVDFQVTGGFAVDADFAEFVLDVEGLAGGKGERFVEVAGGFFLSGVVGASGDSGKQSGGAERGQGSQKVPTFGLRCGWREIIVSSPKLLPGCAVFPDTWRATDSADGRSTD